jgi:hypothetical protein
MRGEDANSSAAATCNLVLPEVFEIHYLSWEKR